MKIAYVIMPDSITSTEMFAPGNIVISANLLELRLIRGQSFDQVVVVGGYANDLQRINNQLHAALVNTLATSRGSFVSFYDMGSVA